MVAAAYSFKIDTARTGTFSGNADDLTSRLIGNLSWNVGMTEADQSFAPPSRLTATFDNSDGAFNPDTLGAEVLTNGTFASWSGDNPTGWTVTGEVGGNPKVGQVGPDEELGGSGTGAALFYSSDTDDISISQTTLTAGTTYKVTFRISKIYLPADTFAGYLTFTGSNIPYHLEGTYTYYFNATSTTFAVSAFGPLRMTVDYISVKPIAKYGGGMISEGMLGQLTVSPGSLQYLGKLASWELVLGRYGRGVVVMTFTDWTLDFLDAEYIPPLYTNVTVDEPIIDVINSGIVPMTYADSGWLLGIQGASELGASTYLYGGNYSQIQTAISEVAFVGDNSIDGKNGVSAQSFLRDLVDAEIYGRFFYDPDEGVYAFHNRHKDTLASSSYTLTENDYEPGMSSFLKTPVINKSTISFAPRSAGSAGTIIWAADDVPIGLYNEKVVITARYRDVSNPSARIGATDIIPMVAGTDYVCIEPGSGIDVTSYVNVSVKYGANSAEITIDNSRNYFAINVTVLQIRGTPLKTFNQRTVFAENRDSQIRYVYAPEQVSYNLIDNINFAQSVANFRVYRNSEPFNAFKTIGWVLNKDSNRQSRGLAMLVGRRFTITDSILGHSADYIVVGFRHSVNFGGAAALGAEPTHEITCTLKPADREKFWILGTSLLGTDTRLAL